MIYPLHARHSAGKLENEVNIGVWKAMIGRLKFIDLGIGTSELVVNHQRAVRACLARRTQREAKRSAFIDRPRGG